MQFFNKINNNVIRCKFLLKNIKNQSFPIIKFISFLTLNLILYFSEFNLERKILNSFISLLKIFASKYCITSFVK